MRTLSVTEQDKISGGLMMRQNTGSGGMNPYLDKQPPGTGTSGGGPVTPTLTPERNSVGQVTGAEINWGNAYQPRSYFSQKKVNFQVTTGFGTLTAEHTEGTNVNTISDSVHADGGDLTATADVNTSTHAIKGNIGLEYNGVNLSLSGGSGSISGSLGEKWYLSDGPTITARLASSGELSVSAIFDNGNDWSLECSADDDSGSLSGSCYLSVPFHA